MPNYAPIKDVGNGSKRDFPLPWPYLNPAHVEVYVNGVSVPYTWLNPGTVRITTAPATGASILVTRSTPHDVLVKYQSGYLRRDDLNYAYNQPLFVAAEAMAEALDNAGSGGGGGGIGDVVGPASAVDGTIALFSGSTGKLLRTTSLTPSAFALAAHTHTTAQVAGLDAALAGKSDTNHSHTTAQVTGLDTALAGKANTSHSHAIGDVTNLTTALAGKSDTGHTHTTAQVTGLDTALAGKANTSHSHAIGDVSGLTSALAGKSDTGHTHTPAHINDFQETVEDLIGSSLVAGTNVTLAYDDTTGKTTISAAGGSVGGGGGGGSGDVVGPASSVDNHIVLFSGTTGKLLKTSGVTTAAFAPATHAHTVSDVTGLNTALSGKSDVSHTHTTAQVTGLDAALAGKSDTGHTHTSANITDFQEAVEDLIGGSIVAGSGITATYNDTTGKTTLTASGGGGGGGGSRALLSSVAASGAAVVFTGIASTPRLSLGLEYVRSSAALLFIRIRVSNNGGTTWSPYFRCSAASGGAANFFFGRITIDLADVAGSQKLVEAIVPTAAAAGEVGTVPVYAGMLNLTGVIDAVEVSTTGTFNNGTIRLYSDP